MKKVTLSFKNYFEESFSKKDKSVSEKLAKEFFADVIHYTPIKLELLDSHLKAGRIDYFYQLLSDFKYLVEFSDSLNRYWYLLRAYSTALSKLIADHSVKEAKKLYSHYFEIYGDRRMLRKEHWFEKKRWEFLDELQLINREDELEGFISKYLQVLSENLKIYVSFIMDFINDLKKLQALQKPVKQLKSA